MHLVELLKAIHITYHRRALAVAQNLPYAVQQLSLTIFAELAPLRRRLEQDRRIADRSLDTVAALRLTQDVLNGPPTPDRLNLARLALAVVLSSPKDLKRESAVIVLSSLRRLEAIGSLQMKLNAATDCPSSTGTAPSCPSTCRTSSPTRRRRTACTT